MEPHFDVSMFLTLNLLKRFLRQKQFLKTVHRLKLLSGPLLLCLLVGCGGAGVSSGGGPSVDNPPDKPPIDNPPDDKPERELSAACKPESVGDLSKFAATPDTRRLSSQQYIYSLKTLTNNPSLDVGIDADPNPEGNVEAPTQLIVTRDWVEQAELNSWAVAPAILAQLESVLNCKAEQNACLDKMIDELSFQVWRRPITAEEKTRMQELAAKVNTDFEASEVPSALISAFLQAPQFIHRHDIPKGNSIAPGLRRIDDWQYAEALALFLWRSQPDQILRDAAARGDLSDPVKLSEQVERMLDHPNAERVTNHIVDQWLTISRLELTNKDEGDWSEAMAKAARLDTEKVFASIMLDAKATFVDLFNHNIAYITPEIAGLFDIQMAANEPGRMVTLTPEQRSGILTHNSFLVAHSKVKGTSGIKRGNSILRQVMCQNLQLPADIVIPPEPKEDAAPTERERLAIHTESPACSACHAFIDPPGLALELWDGIGRARTTENGATIDASGVLSVLGSSVQAFTTPQQMFGFMAEEPVIKNCFVKRWFGEATGTENRNLTEKCGLEAISIAADDGELHLRKLLAELVQHPSFWLRKEVAQQ